MRILIINGPNLNWLGKRNPELYGNRSFEEFLPELEKAFPHCIFRYFQSNHEGTLIDYIQQETESADAIIINGGGLSHSSISLADAVSDSGIPSVEVHISNVYEREEFRHHSYLKAVCLQQVFGLGLAGYNKAAEIILRHKGGMV